MIPTLASSHRARPSGEPRSRCLPRICFRKITPHPPRLAIACYLDRAYQRCATPHHALYVCHSRICHPYGPANQTLASESAKSQQDSRGEACVPDRRRKSFAQPQASSKCAPPSVCSSADDFWWSLCIRVETSDHDVADGSPGRGDDLPKLRASAPTDRTCLEQDGQHSVGPEKGARPI